MYANPNGRLGRNAVNPFLLMYTGGWMSWIFMRASGAEAP
jgi:hypothetical protein